MTLYSKRGKSLTCSENGEASSTITRQKSRAHNLISMEGGGGAGGRAEDRKGAGGVREEGEEEVGSRILKVAGSRKNTKNWATLFNTSQTKSPKRREATKIGREPGVKGTGCGRLPPPPSHFASLNQLQTVKKIYIFLDKYVSDWATATDDRG